MSKQRKTRQKDETTEAVEYDNTLCGAHYIPEAAWRPEELVVVVVVQGRQVVAALISPRYHL